MRPLHLSRRTLAWLETQVARGRAPSPEELVDALVEDARARLEAARARGRALAEGRASGISPRTLAAAFAHRGPPAPSTDRARRRLADALAEGRASGLSPVMLSDLLSRPARAAA